MHYLGSFHLRVASDRPLRATWAKTAATTWLAASLRYGRCSSLNEASFELIVTHHGPRMFTFWFVCVALHQNIQNPTTHLASIHRKVKLLATWTLLFWPTWPAVVNRALLLDERLVRRLFSNLSRITMIIDRIEFLFSICFQFGVSGKAALELFFKKFHFSCTCFLSDLSMRFTTITS